MSTYTIFEGVVYIACCMYVCMYVCMCRNGVEVQRGQPPDDQGRRHPLEVQRKGTHGGECALHTRSGVGEAASQRRVQLRR